MSAQTHQVKTRSAFINTVLRPFDFKYAKRWLSERRDINTDSVRERIEDLERRKLGTSEEVSRWADDVLNLFNDVVIYWGDEADQYYLRPAGTISPKSSRTYVQAWVAFIDKFGGQVLESAISGPSDYESKTLYSMAPPPDYEVGLGQSVPSDMFSNLNAIVSEEALSPSDRDAKTSRRMKTDSISAPRVKAAWVKVLIESRTNESAQATRKWDSLNAFQESLGAWLNSVERIWGPLARELSIKVSVKTRDGETELTIPSVKISEAEEVAIQTANLLQNN
jgi:hypothetical protein